MRSKGNASSLRRAATSDAKNPLPQNSGLTSMLARQSPCPPRIRIPKVPLLQYTVMIRPLYHRDKPAGRTRATRSNALSQRRKRLRSSENTAQAGSLTISSCCSTLDILDQLAVNPGSMAVAGVRQIRHQQDPHANSVCLHQGRSVMPGRNDPAAPTTLVSSHGGVLPMPLKASGRESRSAGRHVFLRAAESATRR